MAEPYLLTKRQMARLAPLLPQDTRGVARVDDRRVISGIVHVLRSGCRWVDAHLPTGHAKRSTTGLSVGQLRAFGSAFSWRLQKLAALAAHLPASCSTVQ
jgi:transposase